MGGSRTGCTYTMLLASLWFLFWVQATDLCGPKGEKAGQLLSPQQCLPTQPRCAAAVGRKDAPAMPPSYKDSYSVKHAHTRVYEFDRCAYVWAQKILKCDTSWTLLLVYTCTTLLFSSSCFKPLKNNGMRVLLINSFLYLFTCYFCCLLNRSPVLNTRKYRKDCVNLLKAQTE